MTIFVPAWGWVGSLKLQKKMPWKAFIFVPEWGWVGSKISRKQKQFKNYFRPRVGMGWFKIL